MVQKITADAWCSKLIEIARSMRQLRESMPPVVGYIEIPNTLREIEHKLRECRVTFQQNQKLMRQQNEKS